MITFGAKSYMQNIQIDFKRIFNTDKKCSEYQPNTERLYIGLNECSSTQKGVLSKTSIILKQKIQTSTTNEEN